ncbi:unnamed protein product, partial [Hymenolepis diminuta]|uniref:Glutathione peroxidase n=1 Tax=Hymenolepis diminuta TaxID=6216 RepID=A0A0R3SRZ1_HYMDI
VFLGGACNPTTWRKDVAIPFLEEKGIPYFNPVSVLIFRLTGIYFKIYLFYKTNLNLS